jgi:predicted signal transduction protein with EAL and GGDEF domain
VRAVCGLAQSFGASTTAQGVETEDQLRRIGAEGCTEVQGYIFDKPMPAEEVPALLARPPAVRTRPAPGSGRRFPGATARARCAQGMGRLLADARAPAAGAARTARHAA